MCVLIVAMVGIVLVHSVCVTLYTLSVSEGSPVTFLIPPSQCAHFWNNSCNTLTASIYVHVSMYMYFAFTAGIHVQVCRGIVLVIRVSLLIGSFCLVLTAALVSTSFYNRFDRACGWV